MSSSPGISPWPAARAVADAIPLLEKAKRVHILTVTNEKAIDSNRSSAELARNLARHGIDVVVDRIDAAGQPIGRILRTQAASSEADLLVMGAYGHSRFREFVLGGSDEGHSCEPSGPRAVLALKPIRNNGRLYRSRHPFELRELAVTAAALRSAVVGAARDEDFAMGRFASTAELYEQFRPPYPPEFFRTVAERLQLSKQHALIDLGTGPGPLAIGFAPYVGHVTAVDPELAMLAVARRAIARAGHAVRLIEGRAEDLPADIGAFDIVTIGRALHWMEQRALGPMFERLVKPEGVIVVCASFSAPATATPGSTDTTRQDATGRTKACGRNRRQGERAHRDLAAALEGTGFQVGEKIRVETTHRVSVSDLAQRVLTFSSSSPAALGDRVDAMLADIEARLSPFGTRRPPHRNSAVGGPGRSALKRDLFGKALHAFPDRI